MGGKEVMSDSKFKSEKQRLWLEKNRPDVAASIKKDGFKKLEDKKSESKKSDGKKSKLKLPKGSFHQ